MKYRAKVTKILDILEVHHMTKGRYIKDATDTYYETEDEELALILEDINNSK